MSSGRHARKPKRLIRTAAGGQVAGAAALAVAAVGAVHGSGGEATISVVAVGSELSVAQQPAEWAPPAEPEAADRTSRSGARPTLAKAVNPEQVVPPASPPGDSQPGDKVAAARRTAAAKARLAEEKAAAARAARAAAAKERAAEKAAEARAERAAREAALAKAFRLPVTAFRITSTFGAAGALWAHRHTGLDFACPHGSAVRAVASGTVVSAGWDGAYGWKTVVRHADGTETWYAHQSAFVVRSGRVTAGQIIGKVGSTGNTTGPHLHLEVRVGGVAVDPRAWLRGHGLSL